MTGAKAIGIALSVFALIQYRSCFGECPKPFWYFAAYWGVLAFLSAMQGPEYRTTSFDRAAQVFQYLILFRISYNMMRRRTFRTFTLLTLAFVCVMVSALQLTGIISSTTAYRSALRYGVLGENVNTVGATFSIGLLASLSIGYERRSFSLLGRALLWLGTPILALCVLRSGSRGAESALVVAVVCFLARKDLSWKKLQTIALAVVAVGALAFVSTQVVVLNMRWTSSLTQSDFSDRPELAMKALEMFFEKPFLGWGPTNNHIELGARSGAESMDTHDVYLWVLTETGLAGGAPFIAGFAIALVLAWRARNGPDGILPFSLMMFIAVYDLSDTWFNRKLFWIVLAYACASYRDASKRRRITYTAGLVLAKGPA
jgi:O-antigen ligase